METPKSTTGYEFTLLPSLESMRTLELLPGAPSDPLRGRLHIQPSKAGDDYEILSYVWGDSTLSYSIDIDDKQLAITASLHSALKRLRLPSRSRILWADGICINQADNDEKANQVSRMGDFYRNAKQVIVHLGEASAGSDGVKDLLDRIPVQLLAIPGATIPEDMLPHFGLPPAGHDLWRAAAALMERPWWRRYWIIQELVLGKKVAVVCGNWECDWESFGQSYRAINELQLPAEFPADAADTLYEGLRGLSNLVSMRATMRSSIELAPSWPLIHLLERFRSSICTNSHDYVFGILGLSVERAGLREGVDTSAVDWVPKYGERPAATFTRFAKYMVEWGDGIQLLYSVTHASQGSCLPSWVPNWANRDVPWRSLAPKVDGGRNYPFKAASDRQPDFRFGALPDSLIVQGIFLGRLIEVGEPATSEKQPSDRDPDGVFSRDFAVVYSFAASLIRFLKNCDASAALTEQEVNDRAWRTVCCNVDALTLRDVDPALGEDFDDMLKLRPLWDAMLAGEFVQGMERFGELMQTGRNFLMRSAPFCLRRRPAVTEQGNPCLVPAWSEKGDEVFLPFGSAVPFVVRPVLGGRILQGECYIHGAMKGELLINGNSATISGEITLV